MAKEPKATKASELDRARGQTADQQKLRDYHEGNFQTHDPVTGQERGPLAAHARPENQFGAVGEENEPADVDTDENDRDRARTRGDEYDGMLLEDLRAEAGDLEVTRGDGADGAPLKADYIKALRKRDRKR